MDSLLTPTSPTSAYSLDRTLTGVGGDRLVSRGDHRFLRIAGRWGYHPTRLGSALEIPTLQHLEDRGSILLSIAPLESLDVSPALADVSEKDPLWGHYALLTDTPDTHDVEAATFAWYWRNNWHPQMIAKFMRGRAGGAAADFGVTPYVPVEHLPLHEQHWYQLALTWDKPASRLRVFVNGILCGTTRFPFTAEDPQAGLFLGNTAMAFADLQIFSEELTAEDVRSRYDDSGLPRDAEITSELEDLFTVRPRPAADWARAEDWSLAHASPFTAADDLEHWHQQGSLEEPWTLEHLEVDDHGLLVETKPQVHNETRMYLWSRQSFEGDVAVSFEFSPESETGLALLVVQATGMQGEDFITDHPPRTTGAMSTIIADRVRNYHWEFYRKAVDVRGDLGTQILVKNPWQKPLAMVSEPPLDLRTWHRLTFVQEGDRLLGELDGKRVFDVTDDAFSHSGPVLRAGRIALRLMYGTRMRFRNLEVWNRPRFEEQSAPAAP